MGDRRPSGKLNTLLLEAVCMLGVLLLVTVFLMRLFVGADSLKRKARDIEKACILAESTADTLKGEKTMETGVIRLKLMQIQDNYPTAIYEKYYDAQWKETEHQNAYRMIVTVEQQLENSPFYEATIVVRKETNYPFIKNEIGNELVSLHIVGDN